MKKHVIVFGLLFFSSFGFSQNVFNTAVGTFVGIGTITPTSPLDIYGGTVAATQTLDLAKFSAKANLLVGASNNTFKIQHSGGSSGGACRLQMAYGVSNLGFIEFPVSRAFLHAPRIAASFGFDSSDLMEIWSDGRVKIGTTPMPGGYKLFVEEGILTEKVKVAIKSTTDWSDYVFATDYDLMPLSEVEAFTKENNHLPNVPSAKEMVENGLDVASMDAKLLEKIEELTLYLIEQKKEIEKLKTEVNALSQKNK